MGGDGVRVCVTVYFMVSLIKYCVNVLLYLLYLGKVVIDAFRLINPNMMVLGQEPRQTTSNLGHLQKPSIQVSGIPTSYGWRCLIKLVKLI